MGPHVMRTTNLQRKARRVETPLRRALPALAAGHPWVMRPQVHGLARNFAEKVSCTKCDPHYRRHANGIMPALPVCQKRRMTRFCAIIPRIYGSCRERGLLADCAMRAHRVHGAGT